VVRTFRPDGGSVLILMPVALLVTLLLGAIAVDAAQRFEAQRQAVADAQALANDAASALSDSVLRGHGAGAAGSTDGATEAPLDPAEVRARLRADVAGRAIRGDVTWSVSAGTVTVTVRRPVSLAFAPPLTGARSRWVGATATAQLVDG
jgi:hypothetical protein